jgi:GT2 family glycosyltransferase
MGPSTPAPRASIVIVTYGQRALTEQCLRSLDACLGERLGREWELVMVDNNSPDDTPALLHAWADRATVRLLDHNRNFAGGCNVGASLARGEVLIFLNNDTEVTPGALERLAEQALEPGVSVAGSRLLFSNGTLQHAGVAFLRARAFAGTSMPRHVFYEQDQELPAARASYEVDCVTAACMAVRAETFRALGGFDERYLNGLEDVDLCLRIRCIGERIAYRGDATVVHHEGSSRGKGRELWATAETRNNEQLFLARWATELDQDDALAAGLWDATLQDHPPVRMARTADVVIQGQPSGIGPAADEARGWLAAFAQRHTVAAMDQPIPIVVPRLNPAMATVLDQARRRLPVPDATGLLVPGGPSSHHEVGPPVVVRTGSARTPIRLQDAGAVWACSPAVARELIDGGLAAEKVSVVPSPILPSPPGPGGEGILAVLPVHEPDRARLVLDALRVIPAGAPVRLLPTVFTRHLDRDVAALLPRVELLRPCSDEARFAALAASADVVVTLDSTDRFERRALAAAGVGAAVIGIQPAGPAAAVLDEEPLSDLGQLAQALGRLLAEPGDRLERARRVARACAPDALVGLLASSGWRQAA